MEGIRDGRAVDNCAFCVFVTTERPCPRCAGRMRYLPAEMMAGEDVDAAKTAYRAGTATDDDLDTLWRAGLTPKELA